MSLAAKLGLLGALYLSQGLPFGFFSQALPVLLRERGVELHLIGATALLALPWALKALWSPLVDRVGSTRFGRRKSWIVPLQLAAAALAAALALLSPQAIGAWLFAVVLLCNLIAATQDIATDALAVELLEPEERGLGNGLQVAGYRLGMILGGGALLIVFARFGWRPAFLLVSAALLLATLPLWRYREPAPIRDPEPGAQLGWSPLPELRVALAASGNGAWLPALFAYKLGEAAAVAMLRPLLVDLGYGLATIGWLLGLLAFGAGLAGALAGGYGAARLGHDRALLLFGVLQVLGVSLYLAPATSSLSLWALATVCVVEHLASGMATAALFTVMMDRCRPGHAATDYTLQASLVVCASGLAVALGGLSARLFGYPLHFAGCALVATGAVYLVSRVRDSSAP